MAYGLRLRIEYRDINEVLTRINIYQDGYAGAADVRYPHAGIRVEWGDRGGDGLPVVYGSACTIYFDAVADYEFLYLFSEDARKHLVEIEKNSALFWKGYIEPGAWSEPLIAAPYPVQCTAYDGLGFLKDTDFVDENGDAYTGRKSWYDILKICLDKTGLSLTINTSINWSEEEQTAGTDVTKQHTLNCDTFTGFSCYDVLQTIFPECRIMQRLGQWWVISNTNLEFNLLYYFRTTPAGSTTTGTFDPVASGFWFEGQAVMDVEPAIKKLTVKQDFGYNANLVGNGSFTDFNSDLNAFENWTNINVIPQQKDLNKDGDKFVFVPGKQYPDTFANEGYGLITDGIKKTFTVKETTSVVKFGLKYGLIETAGAKYAGLMFIQIRLVGTTNTYYLARTPYVVGPDKEFLWVNFDDQPSQGDAHITLKSHLEKTAFVQDWVYGVWTNVEGKYFNTFDPVTPWAIDEISDHFESFKASVPGLPESGSIEIYLFVPYSDRVQVLGAAYANVEVEILDQNEEKYPESETYIITNSARNNYVPEDVTLFVGDYPANDSADIIYRGGLQRLDGSNTTAWTVDGLAAYYTFAELIGRMACSQQRVPRQQYEARLADMIPGLEIIITDDNNPGKRLVENGISYDDRFQAIDGRWTEVLEVDISSQDVEVLVDYSPPTVSGSGGGGAVTNQNDTTPAINNDEQRVQVMDEKSALVSPAGYLDSEYFRAVIDAETGYTRFRTADASGILTDLVSHTVEVTFEYPFKRTPVGRKNIHIYRVFEPETGLFLDQAILFKNVEVTTTGFSLEIDSSEDLAGIVVEYHFTPQTTTT
jgi:hypothetical protein